MARSVVHRVSRNDLVQATARQLGVPVKEAAPMVLAFINQLSACLADGKSVTLSHDGLGRFDVVESPARRVSSPQDSNQWIDIPQHQRIVFHPSQDLKFKLKEGNK